MTDHLTLLRGIPLFADLPESQLLEISGLGQTRHFAPKRPVVRQGDSGGDLFVIISGHAKVVTSDADGRDTALNIMGPGEVFGEVSLLDGAPRSATIVPLEPCAMLVIQQARFKHFLAVHPEVAFKLLAVLAGRLRRLTERAEDIAFLRVAARLAKRVVQLADDYGQPVEGGGVRVVFKLSQQEIGDLVGATRESANKHIRAWEHKGLVSQESGHLIIHQLDLLRQLGGHEET